MSTNKNSNFSLDHELITGGVIDQPLIIVLDEDDELIDFNPTSTTSSNILPVTHPDEQTIISNEKSLEKQSNITVHSPSKSKSKFFHRSFKNPSNKPIRTILNNTNVVRQTTLTSRRRKKSISKRKSTTLSNHLSDNSVLSYITFNQVSNILTISRMGSIYYCVEDLYVKIFTSLCTFDQFISFLLEPQIILLKSVTLSEKISITQENPLLKQFNTIRYRLISIDSSDYLLRLKQLLITNQNAQQIERIIDELRRYKQIPSLVRQKTISKHSLSSPYSFSDLSSDNIERNKHSSPSEIPIQPEHLSSNQIVAFKTDLTEYIATSTTPLSRSNSLIFHRKRIENHIMRSSSLPAIKLHFNVQTQRTNSIEDNYPMPMIVNIEENVRIDHSNVIDVSFYEKQTSIPRKSPSTDIPYLCQSSAYSLAPGRMYYDNNYPEKARDSIVDPRLNSLSQSSAPIMMSLLERPIVQQTLTSDRQLPSNSTYSSQQSINNQCQDFHPDERMIYRQYLSKPSPSNHLKEHRSSFSPYPAIKTHCTPLPNHHSTPPILEQNSLTTPIERKSPSPPIESIDLSRAVLEHHHCDLDKLPKLVIRHRKTYPNKTIDTMGQLFPSWFNEPDYRCIHCFNCDRVFTPQFFMTHVDDKQLITTRPLSMAPIQLLTSETMSKSKVHLWNQFCIKLSIYSREGRIEGF